MVATENLHLTKLQGAPGFMLQYELIIKAQATL